MTEKKALEEEGVVKRELVEREDKLREEIRFARISALIRDSVIPYLAKLDELGASELFKELLLVEGQQQRPPFKPSYGRPDGERPISQIFLQTSLKFLCPKFGSKDYEAYQLTDGNWKLSKPEEIYINEIDLDNLAIKVKDVSISFVWYNCDIVEGRDQQDVTHYPAWVKREVRSDISKSERREWKVICNGKEMPQLDRDSLEELVAREYVRLDRWDAPGYF